MSHDVLLFRYPRERQLTLKANSKLLIKSSASYTNEARHYFMNGVCRLPHCNVPMVLFRAAAEPVRSL